MEVAWYLMYAFLCFTCLTITALLVPLPSNQARGAVIGAVQGVWEKSPTLRAVCLLLAALDAALLAQELRGRPAPAGGAARGACPERLEQLRSQRDALVGGAGLFSFFVMYRLVAIQKKLHSSRDRTKSLERDAVLEKKDR